ncbi:vacuolar protein sorting-associated protein 28 [Phellopilus nigrolimitatus]|nr:vacuolar protein sorting-associated protein 28 [Phellopilus nigrolimitatus]
MTPVGAPLSLDEEVRLYGSNPERERYGLLATLFGIVVALDYLERAYVRDSVPAAEYSPACTRLLSQYKTMHRLVGDDVPSIEAFMARYRMDHPAALHRIRVGVPATVEHSSEAGPETGKWVAETTQSFITFMDALKLRMRAKDQLHPILQELMANYARFKASKDWEGRSRMVSWLITLNAMKASEEISEEQSRQVRPPYFTSCLKMFCRIFRLRAFSNLSLSRSGLRYSLL